jgi:hypothetical protein
MQNPTEYTGPERRTHLNRDDLVTDIVKAIQDSQPAALDEEELRWVRLAIQAEAQRIRVRQAIIEKTLTGLIWMALVALGYILLDYFQARGLNLRPK